jgi:hypothetical protein
MDRKKTEMMGSQPISMNTFFQGLQYQSWGYIGSWSEKLLLQEDNVNYESREHKYLISYTTGGSVRRIWCWSLSILLIVYL